MGFFLEGLGEAAQALLHLDPQVYAAAWRSLWISSLALSLATCIGVPLGIALARTSSPGSRLMVIAIRASMALPTVFIGILCYGMFSRRGPLGPFDVLYTPWAIVVGEFMLALPILIALTHGAIAALDVRVSETLMTLGVSTLERWRTYISEARRGIVVAILSAFARCVTELGIAIIVGGNIKGRTRTLATATAMETGMGEFGRGLAMGLLLLLTALTISFAIGVLSRETRT
ncbi:MAG: ABC transporter permease [Gemmatimonadetes bacterium]|nr:ABC transporter permease [Gemmatimonadota bacterium]